MEELWSRLLLCGILHVAAVLQFSDTVIGVCVPPTCYVDNGIETQCTSCPKGFGVAVIDGNLRQCQSYPAPQDTECRPCRDGYYSDVNSPAKKCKICVPCHSVSEEIVANCNATQNYVCQCKQGEYFRENDTYCKACRSECGQDEQEIVACTPEHDRQCGQRRTTLPATTEATTVTTQGTTNISSKAERDATTSSVVTPENASPITGTPTFVDKPPDGQAGLIAVCVLVSLVVIIVVIIAVIYYCRKRGRNVRLHQGSGQAQSDGSGRGITILCCTLNSGNSNVHNYVPPGQSDLPNGHGPNVQNGVRPSSPTVENGVGHDPPTANGHAHAESCEPFLPQRNGSRPTNLSHGCEEEIPLRNPPVLPGQECFPAHIRQRVIRKLDVRDELDRDWRWFAANQFHLTSDEMEDWQSTGSPATILLRKWEEDGRTIKEFRRCLKEMERDDIRELLPKTDDEEETGEGGSSVV